MSRDRSVTVTEPSFGMYFWIHARSRGPSKAPVTTLTVSSATRCIVRSEWNPPSGVRNGVYVARRPGRSC